MYVYKSLLYLFLKLKKKQNYWNTCLDYDFFFKYDVLTLSVILRLLEDESLFSTCVGSFCLVHRTLPVSSTYLYKY